MAIQQSYDDGKNHVHVLSYGGGTQSTALLLMALKGEVNGVIPDYIIFSDTGWEPKYVYTWIEKVNAYIKATHGKEIIITSTGNIRSDIINATETKRFASLPFYTIGKDGREGMVRRQCTKEYKIVAVNKKIRQLLGYEPRQRVKQVVHLWKGISTDEIRRVKPIRDKWQIAEHPLIDYINIDRTGCIKYVENQGLGTPAKSSCIGCPFHDDSAWREMKRNDPESWNDAVYIDSLLRKLPRFRESAFLHRSCKPLDQVDFDKRLAKKDMQVDFFDNECEGMCGV